jgi:hypothetical protein
MQKFVNIPSANSHLSLRFIPQIEAQSLLYSTKKSACRITRQTYVKNDVRSYPDIINRENPHITIPLSLHPILIHLPSNKGQVSDIQRQLAKTSCLSKISRKNLPRRLGDKLEQGGASQLISAAIQRRRMAG